MKRIAAYPVALLTGGALLLTACSAETNATEPAGLSVVATTTQLGDFTRSVVGEIPARVTQLADVNQSLHGFDPSAGDLVAIREADVIVVNGGGLDGWIEDAIEASGFDGVIVNTSEGIDMDVSPAGAADSHEGEAAEAEEHEALAAAAPEQASAIEANAAGYVDELQALNAWIHENVDKVPADERLLVTSHDAFGHLVDDLGITYVGAVIPSTNDSAEASAEQLDALIAQIKETGVKAVFAESSINSAAAETIADETGAKVYAGDQALYGDSLGTAGSPGETYLGSQAHNVGLVLESWGVTPSEFPATLGK